jgi:hypothetical protein
MVVTFDRLASYFIKGYYPMKAKSNPRIFVESRFLRKSAKPKKKESFCSPFANLR